MKKYDAEQEIFQVGQPTGIPGVNVLEGHQPGPNVGLMGMLHGDEHAGLGLWDLANRLGPPIKGRLYLIIGHPEAFQHPGNSVRSLDHDINRLFRDDLSSSSWSLSVDHKRCLALQHFLPELDILIDIHSTSSCTEPFVVVPEDPCDNLNLALELPITQLFGLDRFLPRTATSWLTRRGRTGIMIEVGQHQDRASRPIAADIACRILKQLNMIGPEIAVGQEEFHYHKRHIGILGQARVEGHDFRYRRHCRNFEALTPGEIVACDATRDYPAPNLDNLVLCMPTAPELLRNNIGSEAFYIGADLSFMSNALAHAAEWHS